MPNPSDTSQIENHSKSESTLRSFLMYAIGLGVLILLIMLAAAFGPSGLLFGAIVFAIAFALIVRRYRFSLRTFLLAVTVLSVWLGLKLNGDVKLNRALSSIASSGGRLTVHDKRQNFPWGLWKHRYRLDYNGLKEDLAEQDFVHLLSAMPNLIWIYLDGTKVRGPGILYLRSHKNLIMLELNGCMLLPSGYQELIQHTNLLSLGLRNSGTTDADLELLSGLARLGILRLNKTEVSDEAVNQFQLSHPTCKIER